MEKPRPGDPGTRLAVGGRYAAFRDMEPSWGQPRYAIADAASRRLDGVQWADWDRLGRLLVATDAGELQVRETPFTAASVTWTADLATLTPEPVEPPAEARRW
jgi:hypothetical protein